MLLSLEGSAQLPWFTYHYLKIKQCESKHNQSYISLLESPGQLFKTAESQFYCTWQVCNWNVLSIISSGKKKQQGGKYIVREESSCLTFYRWAFQLWARVFIKFWVTFYSSLRSWVSSFDRWGHKWISPIDTKEQGPAFQHLWLPFFSHSRRN